MSLVVKSLVFFFHKKIDFLHGLQHMNRQNVGITFADDKSCNN